MKTTKMRGVFGVVAGMIMAVLAMSSGTAQAQVSAAWSTNASGNWSSGVNWAGGIAATGTTGIATFTTAITASRTVTNDSSTWAINRMVFSNSGAFGWTITSNTLNLVGATPTFTVNNISTATVLSVLSGSSGLIKDGTGQLSIGAGGAINNTFTGGLTIKAGKVHLNAGSGTMGGAGSITIGANVGDATLSLGGNGGTSVTYANAIILGGDTGALTITCGSVNVSLSGGVSGSGNLMLQGDRSGNNGTTAFTTGALNNIGTITNVAGVGTGHTMTIGSIGSNVKGLIQNSTTSGLILSGASPAFIGDTTVITGTLNLQNINSLQYSVLNMNGGSVTFGTSASSAITSVSLGGLSGSVNINLNNFLTVPTAVNLTLGNSNASYGGNTLNPTYSAVLSSANGAASLTKVGSNTQTLTGASTYMGPTAVNGGVLELGGASGSLTSTNLNLGGGTFNYTRSGGTQVFSNTTATAGFSAIRAVAGSTLKLGTLATSGGRVDIGNTGTITTSTGNNNGIIGIWATFNNGATWAVANGVDNPITGLLDATYTTTLSAGTTAANYSSANIDVNSSEGLLGGVITPYGLRFNTAGPYTVTLATGTNTLTSGGILVTPAVGANISTITGGTLNGAASAYLNVVQNNTAGGLTIGSIIADNTTATGLAKTGAGLLTLTGTNVYTGATMIEGTLTIGGAGRLGTNGTYAASITNNGALVYSSSAAQSLSGIISGTGSVTKDTSSSSTLTLSGASANTFTGGLVIKAGTVSMNLGGAGSGAITLGDGGSTAATLNAASGVTVGNSIVLSGNTAAALTLSAASAGGGTYTGGVTGSGDLTISKGNGGVITFHTAILDNNGTITVSLTSTPQIKISGIGSNVKELILNSGGVSGYLILTAGNTAFIGDTTLTSGNLGTLWLQKIDSLQKSVLKMNGGTVNFGTSTTVGLSAARLGGLAGSVDVNLNDTLTSPAAVALTIGNSNASYAGNTLDPIYSGVLKNTTTAGGSLIKIGSNTQTLTGANTYSGGTTVSNGTLFVNNTSGSGTGSGAVGVASSATLGGVGTITGTVTVAMGGILAPGTNSVGTLTIRDLVMVTNSVLKTDCLNGLTDLVEVTGQLTAQSNVTVNVNLVGALPSRVTLFHAPNGIITPENLATWSKINAQNYSRIIWDDSAKTVVMVTQSGTILSAY